MVQPKLDKNGKIDSVESAKVIISDEARERLERIIDKDEADDLLNLDPVYSVKMVPIKQLKRNDYNPNIQSPEVLKKLMSSIRNDGMTEPLVTSKKDENGNYTILDGSHRFGIFENHPEYFNDMIPIVELDVPKELAMGITSQMNLHGEHSVLGEGKMLQNIAKEKGEDWIVQMTGLSKDRVINLSTKSPIYNYLNDQGFVFGRGWVPSNAHVDPDNNPVTDKTIEQYVEEDEDLQNVTVAKVVKES